VERRPDRDGAGPVALDFTFSDLVAGQVASVDPERGTFVLGLPGGNTTTVTLTETTYSEVVRNLGEGYEDGGDLAQMLVPGRFLFAYGVYYPEAAGTTFEAKRLVFVGRGQDEHRFEEPGWWIRQIDDLASHYRSWQFPDGKIDYRQYRTELRLTGEKTSSYVQETDTISRLVYGMASAYLLTGDDRYLEVAEEGTRYLREHMRFVDRDENVTYWYHGLRLEGDKETKLLTSEFSDDVDCIPMYEQIYALAGPVQTYRITGDPAIRRDTDGTLRLFERFYKDPVQGGYYSHIDYFTLSGTADSLGHNQARKNWNSVGDHAPAYLINLWLATGEAAHADFLEETFDTIVAHFPDEENSPFVNEKFLDDWSPDHTWAWQQDRAVVGHNLKIVWNLMRMQHLRPKDSYVDTARRIADTMPSVGKDVRRAGWYDVVERTRGPEQEWHRFVWHDRKAWWQQEQAILAYLILAGSLGDEAYQREAREAAAFYNAFFLDHDDGGVYFNVMANGTPYLLGTERQKGSHSMSFYHSGELCFLAAVYGNLMLHGHPLALHFKPMPGGFPDRILRVSPDILPPGSVRITSVTIDGQPYDNFDAEGLFVQLPDVDYSLRVVATLEKVAP
jgi:mannose/cellobiose epimerase-like protein (N-acyl-D-glucosamine 2-epimerase family)